jgi:nucleoside-diphosphate-sugar epimerase
LDIRGTKIPVIGGAGLIGSHIVEELLGEDVKETDVQLSYVLFQPRSFNSLGLRSGRDQMTNKLNIHLYQEEIKSD